MACLCFCERQHPGKVWTCWMRYNKMKVLKISSSLFLLINILFNMIALAVFLAGFLAVKPRLPENVTRDIMVPEPAVTESAAGIDGAVVGQQPIFGRLIFMVIDALRVDFILPDPETDLPTMTFVQELVERKEAYSFVARVEPPTLTMPRIKTMMSGTIPGFGDLLMNLFPSETLEDDNILSQLNKAGKKIVFYGDNTWLQLFPHKFVRSFGLAAANIKDHRGVDNNITAHLNEEMAAKDWDVMILHYSGLDHIGHLAGLHSALVRTKLHKMDDIVHNVYQHLLEQDKNNKLPSLLVLCGDHGMSEEGNHGGASPSEVITPVIFMSSLYKSAKGLKNISVEIEQTDISVTLSLLLGVPIPLNSRGVAITPVFQNLPIRDQLQMLHMNAQQLLAIFKKTVDWSTEDPAYRALQSAIDFHSYWLERHLGRTLSTMESRLGREAISGYTIALRAMQHQLTTLDSHFDLMTMSIAILVLWLVLACLLYGYKKCLSGITIELGWTGTFLLIVLWSVYAMWCSSIYYCSLLCGENQLGLVVTGLLVLTLSVGITIATVLIVRACRNQPTYLKNFVVVNQPMMSGCLLAGVVGHSMSLMVPSAIENENQTWFFYTVLLHLAFCIQLTFRALRITCDKNYKVKRTPVCEGKNNLNFVPLKIDSRGKQENVKNIIELTENGTVNVDGGRISSGTALVAPHVGTWALWSPAASSLLVVMTTILLHAWNRTTHQWALLPSTGQWLVRTENEQFLSVLTAVSLIVVCLVHCRRRGLLTQMLVMLGAAAVFWFKYSNGDVLCSSVYQGKVDKGIMEARIVYAIVVLLLAYAVWRYYSRPCPISLPTMKSPLECQQIEQCCTPVLHVQNDHTSAQRVFFQDLLSACTLLALLQARPHNIALVALVTVQEACMSYYITELGLSTTSLTVVYLWMGQATYYFQGNSNSLGTLDYSAGFIGLEDFSYPSISILLTCWNLYMAPVFWLISLMTVVTQKSSGMQCDTHQQPKSRSQHAVLEAFYTLGLTRVLLGAVFTLVITLHRYHPSIWTIFAPKLIYEAMFTLFISIITIIFWVMAFLCCQVSVYYRHIFF